METRSPQRGSFALSLVLFILMAMTALFLLLVAAVIGLSALTGSIVASVLIFGGIFGLMALIIYFCVLRDAFDRIQAQVDTVYNVANTVRSGYEWVCDKALLWIDLIEKRL